MDVTTTKVSVVRTSDSSVSILSRSDPTEKLTASLNVETIAGHLRSDGREKASRDRCKEGRTRPRIDWIGSLESNSRSLSPSLIPIPIPIDLGRSRTFSRATWNTPHHPSSATSIRTLFGAIRERICTNWVSRSFFTTKRAEQQVCPPRQQLPIHWESGNEPGGLPIPSPHPFSP